jgi:hypothetical protein
MKPSKSTAQFLALIDAAIDSAETLHQATLAAGKATSLVEAARRTVANLKDLRESAQLDRLPHPSRGETPPGAGLGLFRFIGEWTEDNQLLSRVRDVEHFYRTRY